MIEQLPNSVWVCSHDTHHKNWILETGTIEHDSFTKSILESYVKPGFNCLDIGAHYGTLTTTLLKLTGPTGVVIAFEPNRETYECLKRNCSTAICHNFGVSDRESHYKVIQSDNVGASYLMPYTERDLNEGLQSVYVKALDDILTNFKVDFIKADCEGAEVKMLQGAKKLFAQFKPICMLEVNSTALERQGNTKGELFELLKQYGYDWQIAQPDCHLASPQFDILCKAA